MHRHRSSCRAPAALLIAASWAVPVASPRADGPGSIVAGDVIVRFSDGSDLGARVARAVRGEAVPGETEEVAARLSGDLGVPLRVARVTSGGELVLSVEREELARTLARRIARDPAVRSAARVEVPRTVLPASEIALAVELRRGSEEEQQVAEAARAGRRTATRLRPRVPYSPSVLLTISRWTSFVPP